MALYKGNHPLNLGSVTPLVGVGIMGSMRFGLYENFKKILADKNGLKSVGELTTAQKSFCAFLAGCINSLILVKDIFIIVSNLTYPY